MSNDMDYYVENRLQVWANWYARQADFGLGYPTRSLEGKLVDEGGYFTKSTGYRRELNNPAAEEIESLIIEMFQYNINLAQALRYEYIENNTQAHKAKCLGVSLAQFKLFLKMAKAWLSGRLLAAQRKPDFHNQSYYL